jgi:indolepyruvate ferredoxin oxidoreductase
MNLFRRRPLAVTDTGYQLEDRYDFERARGYLTGVQAIVRLLLVQQHRDAAAGHHTARVVSGLSRVPARTR